MDDLGVYLVYRESMGADANSRAGFRRLLARPGFRAFLRRERKRQGRFQERRISGNISNVCTQMFSKIPGRGNTYQTLWRLALRRAREAGYSGANVVYATSADLRRIARILDGVFLGSSLFRYFARKGSPLRFGVDPSGDPERPHGAMYSDSVTNRIVFVRPVWERMPDAGIMDGVPVYDKLEWLCHMMGHELCHSLSNVTCGVRCAKQANNHGRVFKRLNHAIFGHPK